MWLGSLPNDWGLILSLQLCGSSPILFQNRVSLICHCKGVLLLGQNSREVASKARLDRFLFSANWEDKFPTVSPRRMSRLCSDHFPIVLEGGSFQRGSMLFRFEKMWLKNEGFVDKVRSWWDSYQVHGAPSFILANKLKLLKNYFKRWNVEVFGHVEVRIKKL